MPTLQDLEMSKAFEEHFERKRADFLSDYGLKHKPAIVWQVCPTSAMTVDIHDHAVVDALIGGSLNDTGEGWWKGFLGGTATRVFGGVASCSPEQLDGAVTEIHEDGHFLAGFWKFGHVGETVGALNFFHKAFVDALEAARFVHDAAGYSGEAMVGCTMLHADEVPLLTTRGSVSRPPPSRRDFHWPLQTMRHGSSAALGAAMGAQFLRIYGLKP